MDFDDGLNGLLGKFEGGLEFGFGKFFSATLDHEGFEFGPDVDEVKIAFGIFVVGRIGDKFTGDASDTDGGDGSGPRDIGNHEGGGGAVEGKDIGIILAVGAEENGDDLSVVVVAFREKRAERTIDHAAGKDLFFGGATFTPKIATGNATDGGGFFFVFDRKGKEVLAVFDFGGGDGGDDDDSFAHSDEGGAVGEFGQFAGFDGEVAIAQAGGESFVV